MIKVTNTFTTREHGPVIVARIVDGPPRQYHCLTWTAKHVVLTFDELLPIERIATGAPDYTIEGVEEIIGLEIELGEDVSRRPRSPLAQPMWEIEQQGRTDEA
jgi:hypothetical protein